MKLCTSCLLAAMSAVISVPAVWAQGAIHSGAVGGDDGPYGDDAGNTMREVADGHNNSNSEQSGNEGPARPDADPSKPESNPFHGGHNPYLRPNPLMPPGSMPMTLYSFREVNQALRNGYVVAVTTDLPRCTVNGAANSSVTHTGMQIQNYFIDDHQSIAFSATTESVKTNRHTVVKTLQDYQLNNDGRVLVKVQVNQPFAVPASYLCTIGRGILFKLHAYSLAPVE